MTPRVTLRRALHDPELLGTALAGPSWHTWRSILLAAMGEPLLPDELEAFQHFTGRTTAPDHRVDELWACVGRRGGKSRAMAVLATYLAGLCDYSDKLVPAERGTVQLIAPDKKQSCSQRLRSISQKKPCFDPFVVGSVKVSTAGE